MEKSLIGRRYVVKDNSYSKDLSGTCHRPLLYGQTCIIFASVKNNIRSCVH